MAKHCYFALFFDKSYNLVLFFTLFRLCRFDWCCRSSDWTIWAGSLWSLSPGLLSPQSPASSSCCASPTKTLLSLEPLGGMRSGLASTSAGIFDFFLLPLSGHGQVLRSAVLLLVARRGCPRSRSCGGGTFQPVLMRSFCVVFSRNLSIKVSEGGRGKALRPYPSPNHPLNMMLQDLV